MATENRDVRPFRDLHKVQSWFEEHLKLEISDIANSESWAIQSGATLRLDSKTLVTANIQLKLSEGVSALSMVEEVENFASELGVKDYSLFSIVLYGSSPFLKFTDEIARWSFDDLKTLRDGFRLNPDGDLRPRCLQLAHNGVIIDFLIILNRELRPREGLPHRLGTWLARLRFVLANPSEGIGFSPLPLTSEKRKEFRLSKQTATYSQKNPFQPDLMAAIMLDDFVEYYVDESLLARMSADPRHHQSALFQTQIFIGAVEFVVMEFHRLDSLDEIQLSEVNDGLIGKIIRIVSDENTKNLSQWLEILKTDPSRFLAEVEAACDYQRRLDDSMSEMASSAS